MLKSSAVQKSALKSVLITGASSGIGAALAETYARHNHNLVLVARNEEKLKAVATIISKKYPGVSVLLLPQDLTDEFAAKNILTHCNNEKIEIDVLINNAGVGDWNSFEKIPKESISGLLNIHIESVLHLTQAFLPGMIERKCGTVLFVGSVYSFTPVPKQAVYAASKAFMLSFSQALNVELKDKGVHSSILCPGITETGFRKGVKEKRAGLSKMVSMTAEQVAEITYKKLNKNKSIIVPGAFNRVYVTGSKLLPIKFVTSLVDWLVYKVRGLGVS